MRPAPKAAVKPVADKVSAQPHRPVDSTEIAQSYGATSITLMARDPYWIYAYWEIAPESIRKMQERIGDSMQGWTHALRMYDATAIDFDGSNANRWFDIDVGTHTNNWYISMWSDNVTYCADIGIRTKKGEFHALARSNFVTTPRAQSSGRSDVVWMEACVGGEPQPFAVVETAAPERRDVSVLPARPLSTTASKRQRLYLTREDIRAYYAKLFSSLGTIAAARLRGKALAGHERRVDDIVLKGMGRGDFVKRLLGGASEELTMAGGASELLGGGASERQQQPRKFFFDMGTELIVYGRTEPDATVKLGDRTVSLREDGTFTLRFALPDGVIPLDFAARSRDGAETRTIQTSVQRAATSRKP